MAATVRPDDHHVLMRRIGYSVALEPVPQRVPDLIEAYAQANALDRGSWYALCKDWGIPSGALERKKKRAEHFLDVISALGFTTQSEQIISPAPPLEAGAVLFKLFPASRPEVARILLLNQIVESDADVFLNVLMAAGDNDRLDAMINDVVERKREVLMPLFMSGTLRDRLDRILDVARETEVRGRRPPRSPISRDLLTKVTETRTRWAEKLGVLSGRSLTPMGNRLLKHIDRIAEVTPSGGRILWPYDYQLQALRLSLEVLAEKCPIPSVWQLASAVTGAVLDIRTSPVPQGSDALVGDLRQIHSSFEVLNPGRTALSTQMPMTVVSLAHPVLTAMRDRKIADLPSAMTEQRATKESPVVFMKRTGSEGTLIFR